MSWKNTQQHSLADALVITHKAVTELDEVNALIDWKALEALLGGIHRKTRGEKAWPPLIMFKALLLQAWYGLSDPQLEKQLARDLLFRRFVGLSLSSAIPDHSTIWRFRNHADFVVIQPRLLEEVNRQLAEKGFLIKAGTVSIIDATVIQAQRNRKNQGVDGQNTQDPEADYSVKNGSDGQRKTVYGFKAHVNADEDGFIKDTRYTAGNVHDSQCFQGLIQGDEAAVYADSAYASAATETFLAQRGMQSHILARAHRNKPLTEAQKVRNRMISTTRGTVERVFGILKLHYAARQARYLGLVRNHMRFVLMSVAYNMKRGLSVRREMEQWQESCV
jgi:transposase, IS5 family